MLVLSFIIAAWTPTYIIKVGNASLQVKISCPTDSSFLLYKANSLGNFQKTGQGFQKTSVQEKLIVCNVGASWQVSRDFGNDLTLLDNISL